jgi:hypothetical protein
LTIAGNNNPDRAVQLHPVVVLGDPRAPPIVRLPRVAAPAAADTERLWSATVEARAIAMPVTVVIGAAKRLVLRECTFRPAHRRRRDAITNSEDLDATGVRLWRNVRTLELSAIQIARETTYLAFS